MKAAIDAIDRITLIGSCLEAVAELACPDNDAVNRYNLSMLLSFLTAEQCKASDQLLEALKQR